MGKLLNLKITLTISQVLGANQQERTFRILRFARSFDISMDLRFIPQSFSTWHNTHRPFVHLHYQSSRLPSCWGAKGIVEWQSGNGKDEGDTQKSDFG